ncbi:hypothetical protein KDH_10880 [Dictyobacter sp. S3.2.2.5]|uniref:Pectate lyase domain-containing protein n=1 Tax=Dictyobacter halimunensis TaxID=3026934 RepID=A0ABQ6FJ75_9CHLR|nr:hypothetical protein KDH_10880 [Dictyobacter sp. S3.2.2.5]
MVTALLKTGRFWLGSLMLACMLVVLAAPLAASAHPVVALADPLVGYGAGTTGGQGGSTVTVSNLSSFTSAVSGSTARTVLLNGTLTLSGQVKVGSNKTILGVGVHSGLTGGGLDLDGVSNVIIRNLTISFAKGTDDITIIRGTNHVWVDHNEFYSDRSHGKDYYDGQVDITRQSDYVTVSWNRFHDHYKTSLVGHSDSFSVDTGHLHVTYHHNWFYNVGSRAPSLRFGTGHVYNNYFQNIDTSAVHSRMNAQMLIENNVFRNVKLAVTTTGDSKTDGYVNMSGNDLGGAPVDITRTGNFTHAPYSYTLDPASSVISEVTAYSGVGVID